MGKLPDYEGERNEALSKLLEKYPWLFDNIEEDLDYEAMANDPEIGEADAFLIIMARSAFRDIVDGTEPPIKDLE